MRRREASTTLCHPCEAFHDVIHLAGIPGQHDVREQRMGTGNCLHLVPPAPPFRRHFSCEHGALQLVHRFAAVGNRDVVVRLQGGETTARMEAIEGR